MKKELIKKYAFDVASYLLKRLDEIAQLENIDNGWNLDKYISFDPVTADIWKLNLYGMDEDIYFTRESANSKYFKMI